MIQAFERLSLTSTQYYTQISTNQFSQKLLQSPPFKKLDSVTITNFKSFKGKVYVGPLLEFTSIVGPNGAGKSNVLDALMFCFCNEKSKLNFFDIREFITREGTQSYKQMTNKNKYCEVQAKFQLENDKYFTMARTLYPDERQLFFIDGDEYPQKIYQNFLVKNNINYITSNFAIWQGEIDKLLLKNPKQLTNYIENISGSIFFKKEQQDLKNQISDIDDHMESRSMRIAKLRQQKKYLKNINNQKASTLKIQEQYEQVLKKIVMLKSFLANSQINEYQLSIQKKEKQEKQTCRKINQTKAKIQREQAEKLKIEQKIQNLMREISVNYSKLKNKEQLQNVIDQHTISGLSKQIDSLRQYCQNLKRRRDEIEKEVNSVQSNQINKQYLELYTRWENQNQSINKQFNKRREQYLCVQGILQSKRNIIEQFHQKELKQQSITQLQIKQKEELQNNIKEIDNAISRMKNQQSKLNQSLADNKRQLGDLQHKVVATNEKLIDLESLLTQSVQHQKDRQLVLKLSPIDGFQGSIQQWVQPSHKKYQLCFQLIMGPVLKYLLCSDQIASKQVAVKLRQNYQMKNVVILKNVFERKQSINRTMIGKLGFPAIQALQFDKKIFNFELFLKQYLNGKVICEDLGAAWHLLGQNIRGIREIYTVDGNVLRGDGTISSFGSLQTKKKYKYVDIAKNNSAILQDMQSLQKEKQRHEQQLQILKKKVSSQILSKNSIQIQKLSAKKEQIKLKIDAINKSIETKKNIKIPKTLQKQIEQLEKRALKLSESTKQIQKQMLKSKIFKDFVSKNKIKDLDNFRSVQDLSSLQNTIRLRTKITKQLQQTDRQIIKINSQIQQKDQKLQRLTDKFNTIKGFQEKQDIQKRIQKQQSQLSSLKHELSKTANINLENLNFKSQIPQMVAKLQVMRQRQNKNLKIELQSIGLSELPLISQYKILNENLGTTIERASKQRIEQTEEELQKQKAELEGELEKNNVGFGQVKSQFQNDEKLETQIQRLTTQLRQQHQRKNQLLEKFQKVKGQRKAVFMNFMDQMKPTLQRAYQILTQKQQITGKVEIYLQNQQFPCDGGIYYTPVPPAKRFVYDLDQLSGGQKSIASLALQYTIAMTSKSPFLILDETDAFLDSENINRFKNLIKKTLNERKLQFILITHKRSLFLEGESLVGVTKFKDDPFSKAFSLRLNDPDDEREQNL